MLNQIEISCRALNSNIAEFRKLLNSKVEIAAVVKANAYGHGLTEVVRCIEAEVDYFQIDDLVELRAIRQITKKPVLLLGYAAEEQLAEVLKLDCELAIFSLDQLQKLIPRVSKDRVQKIHLALDCFLGREGVLPANLTDILELIAASDGVKLAGIYGHFANIEDTSDFSHAEKQLAAFEEAREIVKKAGFKNIKTHISATSGILEYELERKGNKSIVRLGIGLYGMWPSAELEAKYNDKINLLPVLCWKSKVAQIKELPANYPIGYGLTFVTVKPTRVALIPQGYSDGYPRAHSNNGTVLIDGQLCPILGRVAMNMMVADVSRLKKVKVEDEVIILGKQGKQNICAEMLAEQSDTINYEVTTRISALLERVITD